MRYAIIAFSLLLGPMSLADAQVAISIGIPGSSVGIYQPSYPDFNRVPGYPVYYAPQARNNMFFYDGLYWVYQRDQWYASSWYNGPWGRMNARQVPVYVLRVPVAYYRAPPPYFRGWPKNSPPRWGQYYGPQWEQDHHGWETWDRRAVPAPAPLPVYQRQYSGVRYPPVQQQYEIHDRNYQYRPSDPVVREQYEQRGSPPKGKDEGGAHGNGKGKDNGKGTGNGKDAKGANGQG